jgi:hypothetical protein
MLHYCYSLFKNNPRRNSTGETQYPGMKAYLEYVGSKSSDSPIWKGGSVFGDWIYPVAPALKPKRTYFQTPQDGLTS